MLENPFSTAYCTLSSYSALNVCEKQLKAHKKQIKWRKGNRIPQGSSGEIESDCGGKTLTSRLIILETELLLLHVNVLDKMNQRPLLQKDVVRKSSK